MSHIEISNRIIDKRYRVRRVGKQKCSNCHNPSRLLYDYENLPHSICELCNTVFRYSSRTMKSGVICHTNLTQLEIIRKTYEFLKKNTRIPRISEVDSDARIVKYPFPDLLKALKSATRDQRKEFSDLKLFFTDMIDYNAFHFNSMFKRPTKYPEYQFFEVVAKESGRIDLTSKQIGIINLYLEEASVDSEDHNSYFGSKNKSKSRTKTQKKTEQKEKKNIRKVRPAPKAITRTRIV